MCNHHRSILWYSHCLSLFGLPQQNTVDQGAYEQETLVSHSSGRWKAKARVQADSVSGEGTLLVHRQPSSPCVLNGRRGERTLWSLSYKGSNSILRAPPSRPSCLPEAPPPTPSHWGLSFKIEVLGVGMDTNIQSVAPLTIKNPRQPKYTSPDSFTRESYKTF